MAIYHLHVKAIGRKQGHSSVVAAAVYRAGEKLVHTTSWAAYRAGEELRDVLSGITYDYSKRTCVVHNEIMLPQNAPKEFGDRETLWNAVEQSEKRADARTAREVELALPIKLDLQEQIDLLRKYITENFVKEGMCAEALLTRPQKQ